MKFFKSKKIINNKNILNSNLNNKKLNKYNDKFSTITRTRKFSTDYILQMINNLMLKGKFDEALSLAKKELKNDNNNTKLYNAIGALLYNSNQKEEAERNFQKALILYKKKVHAFSNMGKIYEDKGDFVSALKCFSRSYDLDNNSKTSYQNLKNFLLKYFPAKFNDLWLQSYEMVLTNKTNFEIDDKRSLQKLAVKFLMTNTFFKRINFHIENKLKISENFFDNLFNLSKIKLFHIYLQDHMNYDLKFENFLKKLRDTF